MNSQDPKITALQFNQCITDHDLDGLARLMTDDHAFVDRAGTTRQTKRDVIAIWEQFFQTFPNYRNTFERVQTEDNVVIMLGFAYWSEDQPHDPAIWTATIVNDLVCEWRIYYDTPENRRKFSLP